MKDELRGYDIEYGFSFLMAIHDLLRVSGQSAAYIDAMRILRSKDFD